MSTKRYPVYLSLVELQAAQAACAHHYGFRMKRDPAQVRADSRFCDAIVEARAARSSQGTST